MNFKPLNIEEINLYFEKNINSNILRLSEGSIGKALKLKEKTELYNQLEKFLNNLEVIRKTEIFSNVEMIYKNTEDIQEILSYMNLEFYEKGKTNELYLNCIQTVENARKRLKANSNYNMTIDNLLLQIWEEINEKYSRG